MESVGEFEDTLEFINLNINDLEAKKYFIDTLKRINKSEKKIKLLHFQRFTKFNCLKIKIKIWLKIGIIKINFKFYIIFLINGSIHFWNIYRIFQDYDMNFVSFKKYQIFEAALKGDAEWTTSSSVKPIIIMWKITSTKTKRSLSTWWTPITSYKRISRS